ncbi:hypothetical protein BC941DRAFT_483938 [Chlamydoabsidia padenii]|nr:hypothetical protein BC941DRAFT_483938 [Chlamydoabsidia padenii]
MSHKIVSYLCLLCITVATVMAADRGSYTIPGYHYRKQGVFNNGGGTLELAIAMLETDNMGTDYPYGDNKSQDSANFGLFKQGWYMLRSSCSLFKGQSKDDWNNGAFLNSHLWEDVHCRQESQNFYGIDKWFGGHRNGETGLNNPYTQDITNYKNAIYWIKGQIESDKKYLTDDTRFWVNVPAI